MVRIVFAAFTLVALSAGSAAHAQERKAYKSVDEKGNVTYSQTPPVTGKDPKSIDISPANSSRGDSYSNHSWRSVEPYSTGDSYRYEDASRAHARRMEEARQRRRAELESECERARGTDCSNPEALRYIESQKIPRRGGR